MGTYSPGNVLLTCAIIIQVFPTVPSPTATHLTCFRLVVISNLLISSTISATSVILLFSLWRLYLYKFANLKIVSSLFPNKVFDWTDAIVDSTGHAQKGGAGSVVIRIQHNETSLILQEQAR